jgi:hypothetical protein
MEAKKTQKKPKYFCNECNFNSSNKKDFTRHLTTRKHNDGKDGSIGSNETEAWKPEIPIIVNRNNFNCIHCNKTYMSRGSLWKHNQKCKINNSENTIEHVENIIITNVVTKPETFTNDMILELIKQNKELQNTLIEQSAAIMEQNTKLVEITSKGQTNINNTNSNNTTNNNQFNINLFLNEQCKNAVNIVDFLNSLQVQIQDLEKTGKLGYVEGISSIFLKGLRELNVYQRPIHCTDLKRETVYVKDNDTWEKDNAEKTKLKNVIKHIAKKNLKTLPKWQQENPDFITLDTKENNDYLKIALNSLGGQSEEEDEKFTGKIIRNVLKDVVIDKTEIAR